MTGGPVDQPATVQHEEGWLPGTQDVEIYWQSWTPPEASVRAVVLLAHGGLEHSGRYAHVAAALVHAGLAVYAPDFRGHGRSGGRAGQITRMAYLVDDLERVRRLAVARHPDLPVFVLGHSLGAMVALEHVLEKAPPPAGLVLSGTGIDVSGIPAAQAKLAGVLSAVTPNLGLIALDSTTISRDPAVVAAYDDDPLVFRGKVPVRTAAELLKSAPRVTKRLGEVRVPLLVVHGGADTVAAPAGARLVHSRASALDKTLSIHDGLFHEIFNEPERDQVIAEVVQWIRART